MEVSGQKSNNLRACHFGCQRGLGHEWKGVKGPGVNTDFRVGSHLASRVTAQYLVRIAASNEKERH